MLKLNRILSKSLITLVLCLSLTGCDLGLKQLGPTEYAVRFRILPRLLGGGIASKVKMPGETFVVWPWENIFVLDTRIRNLEWGAIGGGSEKQTADFVQTRAFDGNEVSLAVRIQYSLTRNPDKLKYLIENVGTTNEDIDKLVVSAARADLRTHMNKLKTAEFFRNEAKYRGESEVKSALIERLDKHGITVQSINLKEHRFERVLPDGSIDRSYQERINQVQTLEQETEREKLRKNTVVAEKTLEYNVVQAEVNRLIEEAVGYKIQAEFRGDGYYAAKSNEASGILAAGESFIKGLEEKINALSGPGGKALLKLEIAKSLLKSNPRFIVTGSKNSGSSKSNSIDVRKINTNDLLDQIGVFESLTNDSVPARKNTESIIVTPDLNIGEK